MMKVVRVKCAEIDNMSEAEKKVRLLKIKQEKEAEEVKRKMLLQVKINP